MVISMLIAISLSFDTFSIAIVEGTQTIKPTLKNSIFVGIFFGLTQAFMALLGAFLGFGFKLLVTNIDHWIAFVLLTIIGIKLIKESRKSNNTKKKSKTLNFASLILLAIATSIDALAVGITLIFMKGPLIAHIIIIGIVTFIIAFTGYFMGKRLKIIFKNKAKIVGGLILIIIGLKILLQHLFFGS